MPDSIIFDLIGNDLISGVFDGMKDKITEVVGASLQLAGSFEQSEIAYTSMLDGNGAAADVLLGKLQTLANYTPFTFADESAAARQLLAMGQSVEKVLPELKDIDTAVSAIGGGDQAVGRVTAALSKMDAAGKTSAVYLNELTRDGFPAWQALAEEMGLSVAQVRALSEQGQIASSVFDQAFHDYTVKHFGDALAQQSQTFDGLMSTASDLGAQFERTFGAPIIQELEPKLKGILNALSDPAVIATIHQWGVEAGTFLGYLLDAGVEIARWAGLPIPNLDQLAQDSGAAALNSAEMNVSWTGVPPKILSAKEQADALDTKIADLRDKTNDLNRSYTQQIDPLRAQLTALDQIYQTTQATQALTDAESQLADDKVLAVNRFSAVGVAARKAEAADQKTVARDQAALAHDAAKDQLTNQIAGLEAAKKRVDDEAAYQIQVWERTKRTLQDIIIAPAIRPTVDAGFLAHEGALTADRFTTAVIAGATPKVPAVLTGIFGTEAAWDSLGLTIGDAIGAKIGTAIGRVDWLTSGENIGSAILEGVGSALSGLGGHDDLGTAALGRMFMDIGKGDFGAAASDWLKWSVLPVGKTVADATVFKPPGSNFDTSGLPGSGNAHVPAGGPPGTGTPPAAPPPGRSANRGHYIAVAGAWVWRDDNPDDTHASVYPTPGVGSSRGVGDGASGANSSPYGAPVTPAGGPLPTAYTGYYPTPAAYGGSPSYPGTSAGAPPPNVTVHVHINGPASQQDWNAVGAQISEAITHHLEGGR